MTVMIKIKDKITNTLIGVRWLTWTLPDIFISILAFVNGVLLHMCVIDEKVVLNGLISSLIPYFIMISSVSRIISDIISFFQERKRAIYKALSVHHSTTFLAAMKACEEFIKSIAYTIEGEMKNEETDDADTDNN